MKNTKTIRLFLVMLLLAALTLTACGSASTSQGTASATGNYSLTDQDGAEADTKSSTDTASEDRKLVKTVYFSAETESFDSMDKDIRSSAESLGGFLESTSVTKYNQLRQGDYLVRIPADKLDSFVDSVSGKCTVTSKNEQVSDITDTYDNIESELNSLNTELISLNQMMEKAETVTDSITIQSRITEVRTRIDELTRSRDAYDSQIAYSTVEIYLTEVSVESASNDTVGSRIVSGFRKTAEGVGNFFVDLFIFIVSASPALAVIAAVVVATVFIAKRGRRKKKANGIPFGGPNAPPYNGQEQNPPHSDNQK